MLKKFHIGIDARPLSTPVSGVGRLIAETLIGFPEKEKFEFHFFSHRPLHFGHEKLLNLPNVTLHIGKGWIAKKGGFYFNFYLPFYMQKLKLHLFWGTQQVLPPFLSSTIPAVLTYHDSVIYILPETMRAIAKWQQQTFLKYSVKRSDFIISNSMQTRNDMVKLFSYPLEKTDVAYPGVSFKEITDCLNQKPSEEIEKIKNPFFLSVSTIEPRKNYKFLLELYRSYRERSGENKCDWVIVGRRGWESEDFYKDLERDIEKYKDIILFSNASDVDLHHLYRRAIAFLFASKYEGFGIPLLEALAHGKKAIVSDIPTFHEIGKEAIIYHSLEKPNDWLESMLLLSERKEVSKIDLKDFSWEKSAEVYYRIFLDILNNKNS